MKSIITSYLVDRALETFFSTLSTNLKQLSLDLDEEFKVGDKISIDSSEYHAFDDYLNKSDMYLDIDEVSSYIDENNNEYYEEMHCTIQELKHAIG